MEICRRITNIWTVTLRQEEVFNRVTDESLMASYQRAADNPKGDGTVITDDDRAYFERYYRTALAELSALLARRTTRFGGSIVNSHDQETGYMTTVYTMPMSDNHESELLPALATLCLDFMIARVQEQWYGMGTDFGSKGYKEQIRHVLHFRRIPIERPGNPL